MNVRGFFKNVLNQDQAEMQVMSQTEQQSKENQPTGMSGFLSSTSKFLDSVQTKKTDLFNDISTKLSSIKLPGETVSNTKTKKSHGEGDGDSSASEYGDDGDRPLYADEEQFNRVDSVDSVDSLVENEALCLKKEVHEIVKLIFGASSISAEMEANFQNYILHHTGRSAYSKEVKTHVKTNKSISNAVLQTLAKLTSHVLVHCNEIEDFTPATHLMQAAFTVFTERKPESFDQPVEQVYLFTLLRNQPIWQSMRFWNAAFFTALQSERRYCVVPAGLQGEEALQAEKEMHTTVAFAEISKFLWRMHALDIAKEPCLDFLRKQVSSETVSRDKYRILKANLDKLYVTEEDQSVL